MAQSALLEPKILRFAQDDTSGNILIKMLMRVIKWDDGKVVAFDERGQKIPELNGRYEEVRDRVIRDASPETKFFRGISRFGVTEPIKREEW